MNNEIEKEPTKTESAENDDDIVKFNIGGTIFSTLKSTITKRIAKSAKNSADTEYYEPNLLESYIRGDREVKYDEDKAIFVDRSPKYFSYMLDFLRDEFRVPDDEEEILNNVFEEAEFYHIHALLDLIVPFKDSTILTSKNAKDLVKLCGFSLNDSWSLLYRGSTNGFNQKEFHTRFDGIPKSLIIAKSSKSSIFGCYTDRGWNYANKHKSNKNSFLFNLILNDDDNYDMFKASDIEIYTKYVPDIIRV